MSRKRKLVLLLCAAAVLAGGTFAILGREQKKVLKESTGTFALAGGTLALAMRLTGADIVARIGICDISDSRT